MSGEWFGVGVGGQDRDARPTIEGTIKRNEKARNHAKVEGGRREGGELRQHYDDARRAHNM